MKRSALASLALLSCFLLFLRPVALNARKVLSITYQGCYRDNSSVRDLDGLIGLSTFGSYSKGSSGAYMNSGSMTRQMCSDYCSTCGFPYMGLQSSSGCYCCFNYGRYGASACAYACAGDSTKICGGFGINSVFQLTYTNNTFRLLESRPTVTAGSPYPPQIYVIITARNIRECIMLCSVDCQAVIFNQQSDNNTCYLLKFPLVPSGLTGIAAGDFYALV